MREAPGGCPVLGRVVFGVFPAGSAGEVSGDLLQLEPWLDKAAMAEYLGCGERWLEYRAKEGMPHAVIAGRIKFRPSECEPWLEDRGHFERRNGE